MVAIAGLTTTGIIARTSGGAVSTRTITGTAGRIAINNGNGVSGNPTIDLITTTISAGDYNTESLTSAAGSQTVNATKFSVDAYGRFTSAATVPIATAVEGTTALLMMQGLLIVDMQLSLMHRRFTKHLNQLVLVLVLLLIPVAILEDGATSR